MSGYYRPQRSCGKVMFLHVSVILSTVEGGGRQTPPGQLPWADSPWADSPRTGRHHPPPTGTATAAGGTHPYGMHSCRTTDLLYMKMGILILCSDAGPNHMQVKMYFTIG